MAYVSSKFLPYRRLNMLCRRLENARNLCKFLAPQKMPIVLSLTQSSSYFLLASSRIQKTPKQQQLRIGPLFCNFMTWKRRVQFGLCLSTPVFIFSWLIAHMEKNLKPQLIHHQPQNGSFFRTRQHIHNTFLRRGQGGFFSRDALLGSLSSLDQSRHRVKIESNFHMDEERRRQVLQATKEEEDQRRLAHPCTCLKKV